MLLTKTKRPQPYIENGRLQHFSGSWFHPKTSSLSWGFYVLTLQTLTLDDLAFHSLRMTLLTHKCNQNMHQRSLIRYLEICIYHWHVLKSSVVQNVFIWKRYFWCMFRTPIPNLTRQLLDLSATPTVLPSETLPAMFRGMSFIVVDNTYLNCSPFCNFKISLVSYYIDQQKLMLS